jgi:hypothetical protein
MGASSMGYTLNLAPSSSFSQITDSSDLETRKLEREEEGVIKRETLSSTKKSSNPSSSGQIEHSKTAE